MSSQHRSSTTSETEQTDAVVFFWQGFSGRKPAKNSANCQEIPKITDKIFFKSSALKIFKANFRLK